MEARRFLVLQAPQAPQVLRVLRAPLVLLVWQGHQAKLVRQASKANGVLLA